MNSRLNTCSRPCITRPRRSRQTFPWTIMSVHMYSVRTYVRASVCPVHCGKTTDWIRMPFGIIGRTGPGMRQVVGFGDRSTRRGTFGGEFGARHCNYWELYGVHVWQRREAALFPKWNDVDKVLFSFYSESVFRRCRWVTVESAQLRDRAG